MSKTLSFSDVLSLIHAFVLSGKYDPENDKDIADLKNWKTQWFLKWLMLRNNEKKRSHFTRKEIFITEADHRLSDRRRMTCNKSQDIIMGSKYPNWTGIICWRVYVRTRYAPSHLYFKIVITTYTFEISVTITILLYKSNIKFTFAVRTFRKSSIVESERVDALLG